MAHEIFLYDFRMAHTMVWEANKKTIVSVTTGVVKHKGASSAASKMSTGLGFANLVKTTKQQNDQLTGKRSSIGADGVEEKIV